MTAHQDYFWMQQALSLAEQAASVGEVPVGALVVLNGQVIGKGHNAPITTQDPTAHAEMVALRKAAATIHNYRLLNTTLYVTLEPCAMCASAMVHARIKRLVFGVADPKSGAIVSRLNFFDQLFLNHRIDYCGNILEVPCGQLLKAFFQLKRKRHDA